MTALLLIGGMIAYAHLEFGESLAGLPLQEQILTSFFASVIALRPATQSTCFKSVSGEQVIAANDALLSVSARERCLEVRKVK